MIRLSLLPAGHARTFQRSRLRASRPCYGSFTLPTGRSRGFGPIADDLGARFGLAFATAARMCPRLALPPTITRRSIMQKVRRHTFLHCWRHSAPTACKCRVSGTFHTAHRRTFHRSIALLVRYRSSRSIQPWPVVRPTSRGVPRDPRYSGTPLNAYFTFRIRDCHPLWCDFPDASARLFQLKAPVTPARRPVWAIVRVRSPLLTESMSLSSPAGT